MEHARIADFLSFTKRLDKALFYVKGEEGRNLHLKGIHVLCLFYICGGEPMSAMDLSRATGEDKGAISKALEKLRSIGFVEPRKGYMEPIKLTKKGEEASARLMKRIEKIASLARIGIPDEEDDAFLLTMKKYVDNFDKAISENKEAKK